MTNYELFHSIQTHISDNIVSYGGFVPRINFRLNQSGRYFPASQLCYYQVVLPSVGGIYTWEVAVDNNTICSWDPHNV